MAAFTYEQDDATGISIRVAVPPATSKADVAVTALADRLRVSVTGHLGLDGELYYDVDPDATSWALEGSGDARELVIELTKAEPVDWDAAWQAEVALPLFVESLARNYNTGMEPKQVAMQRLVGVCIAIGVFCAVCHLYVLHTGGILIMPDGIYTIHERSRGAAKLLPSTATLSLHRDLFGALF